MLKYAEVFAFALNPAMQGSGTSLKVLDYLSSGLPILYTASYIIAHVLLRILLPLPHVLKTFSIE